MRRVPVVAIVMCGLAAVVVAVTFANCADRKPHVSYDVTADDLCREAREATDLDKRLQAIMAIPNAAGYRGTTCLIELLTSDSAPVRAMAVAALTHCGNDPRVRPALYSRLTRAEVFGDRYDQGEAPRLLAYLGGYPPVSVLMKSYLEERAVGKEWWSHAVDSVRVPDVLDAMQSAFGEDAPLLYNRILTDMPVDAVGSQLLFAALGIADSHTVQLLVALLDAPDRTLSSPESMVQKTLHGEVVGVLSSIFLWIERESLPGYARQFAQDQSIEEVYVRAVQDSRASADGDRLLEIRILKLLALRDPERAIALMESDMRKPATESPAISFEDALLCGFLARWGVFDAFEVLIEGMETAEPDVDEICRRFLKRAAGIDCGYDGDAWRWWLEQARKELRYEVSQRSWEPAEAWEALAKTAELRASGTGR